MKSADAEAAEASSQAVRDVVHAVRFSAPVEKIVIAWSSRSVYAIRHRNGAVGRRGYGLRGLWDSIAIAPSIRRSMIVIALDHVLFAAMSGSVETVLLESIVMAVFAIAAVVGFKSSVWIVVGGAGCPRRV